MFSLDNLYRWYNTARGGGGLVIATSEDDARDKLIKKHGYVAEEFIVWSWKNDDYFDENNQDVLDIYG